MYGLSTDEPMPGAFLTDHTVWDNFVGSVWAEILRVQNADPKGVAVELAPGTSVKVGAALAEIGFCGRLYVVDASSVALEALKPKYAALLPNADITFTCSTIRACVDLPGSPDMLLGSHVIDDMILSAGEALRGEGNSFGWAAAYTHHPSVDVQKSWSDLSGALTLKNAAEKMVTQDIQAVITRIMPRLSIFSQYPSATLKDHDMQALNDSAALVLQDIKEYFSSSLVPQDALQSVLNRIKNYGNAHIGDHLLNAEYWMLCRRP